MLTVYIDFKSPASYLALAPTMRLIDELSVPVRWRPFSTREREQPDNQRGSAVAASHFRVRSASRRAMYSHYAQLQDLPLHWPPAGAGSDLALGVLALADEVPREFLKAAFESYWVRHEDLDDIDVLRRLIAPLPLEMPTAGDALLREALAEAQAAAEAAGVVEAPAYVVENQLFIGREHLPWIRELLGTR